MHWVFFTTLATLGKQSRPLGAKALGMYLGLEVWSCFWWKFGHGPCKLWRNRCESHHDPTAQGTIGFRMARKPPNFTKCFGSNQVNKREAGKLGCVYIMCTMIYAKLSALLLKRDAATNFITFLLHLHRDKSFSQNDFNDALIKTFPQGKLC